jgi:glycyl-tRNA synthetase
LCTKQVRTLKKDKAPQADIDAAVKFLLEKKTLVEAAQPQPWDRAPFEDLLKQRFVYAPAFELYGGVAGLYDYGPIGCAIKTNLIKLWRKHFILHDGIYEIDCPAMTPEEVLRASGHVERFADIMVKDTKNGECLRADHLLEDVMEVRMADTALSADERKEAKLIHAQADDYDKEGLQALFKRFEITSPAGNPLSEPEDFNMMFATNIGPSGQQKGYLRPETAQGIFLAFKRLYEFNNKKLPFAGAQIGVAYRNEISPAKGLLRVREFQMAEIEHFVDPLDKSTTKFESVADLVVPLAARENQLTGIPPTQMTLREAVATGVIGNETVGYFLGRIFLFMQKLGVNMKKLRFRQHLANEMAHYACDCWDTELHMHGHGWIECVGCADRSAYDLEAHQTATGTDLRAAVKLATPNVYQKTAVVPNKKKLGPTFRKDAKAVEAYFENLSDAEVATLGDALSKDKKATITVAGKDFEITDDIASVQTKTVTEHERKFVPGVIEPSFGIGRILYCLLEHVYDCRDNDPSRGYLKLPPDMAPVKCSVLPLSSGIPELNAQADALEALITKAGVSCRIDKSGASIGKRYARTDEIAIPFGITVDFETVGVGQPKDGKATLRERDSMEQIRVPVDEMAPLVAALSATKMSWADAVAKYGLTQTGGGAATEK